MERLLENITALKLDRFRTELEQLVMEKRDFLDHAKGNFLKFKNVLEKIPAHRPSRTVLSTQAVTIGQRTDLTVEARESLRQDLMNLCPWRKGPFDVFGISIDSEWQSWMKWDRLEQQISPLEGRKILDIGSSNGYYMFRMAGHNPLMVLGIEPQSSFYFQYLAIQKFLSLDNVYCLPVTHDRLPELAQYFDTVFCMGILYHRKSPVEMLEKVYGSLRTGGELVLENLVLDSHENRCLFPSDRYAKMRNVFFIPDLLAMESWLLRAGFKNVRCVDVTRTNFEEQRKTEWIQTQTLQDFLDPENPEKTVEGYPAPVRAVFIAEAG